MRCFYQSDPTRRGYQKRMIAIWREIGTFEITEQRLVYHARVIRINEQLTEVELEEIRRKSFTPRDGEKNQVGVKKSKRGEEKEPWWKRRIESDITNLRRNIKKLEREKRGENGGKGKRKIKELNTKYRVKKIGINLLIEELQQMLIAKRTKVKRYEQRISQFRQNQLFQVNQKQVYKELNGEKKGGRIIPNSGESIKFWSDIWSIRN